MTDDSITGNFLESEKVKRGVTYQTGQATTCRAGHLISVSVGVMETSLPNQGVPSCYNIGQYRDNLIGLRLPGFPPRFIFSELATLLYPRETIVVDTRARESVLTVKTPW